METSRARQLPGSPVFGWVRSAGNGKLLAALRAVPPQHIAATLLAAVVAFQAAVTLSSIVRVLKHRPRENAGATHVEPATPHSFASIAAAHLFGAPPPKEAETKGPQPVSSAPLVLAGTIALADVTQGLAIIGSDIHSARIHGVGETVADGITLKEVYPDHAIIDRGGQIETVWLPHSSLLQTLTPKVFASASPTSAAVPDMPPMPSDIRDRFAYENQRMGTALTETPLMAGEVFRGLLVQAGPDPSILQQMGLRPGDEVLGVDGITIMDAEHIDLLRKALLSGHKFRVDVVRRNGGGQESLELDAGAFQGLITN